MSSHFQPLNGTSCGRVALAVIEAIPQPHQQNPEGRAGNSSSGERFGGSPAVRRRALSGAEAGARLANWAYGL